MIPFGSSNITEDVKNGCMVMRNEAELLKIKSGYATAELVKKNEKPPGIKEINDKAVEAEFSESSIAKPRKPWE